MSKPFYYSLKWSSFETGFCAISGNWKTQEKFLTKGNSRRYAGYVRSKRIRAILLWLLSKMQNLNKIQEHPTCSPDLAPSAYFLFPEVKEDPRRTRCSDDSLAIATNTYWLENQPEFFPFKNSRGLCWKTTIFVFSFFSSYYLKDHE